MLALLNADIRLGKVCQETWVIILVAPWKLESLHRQCDVWQGFMKELWVFFQQDGTLFPHFL